MIVTSVVRFSQLKGSKRLDADRYQAKYLELESYLQKLSNIEKLKSLISKPVRTGKTPSERDIHSDDKTIFFVKTNTLRIGLIDFENSDFLPVRSTSKNNWLKSNEILVTIIGATQEIIGRSAIFLPTDKPSVVNQNVAVIRADEQKINPFYLMVFLNCKYGREQLWMLSRQTEQVNLNCREVEELLVPLYSTSFYLKIEIMARKFYDELKKSKNLYSEAENIILRESDFLNFKKIYQLTYTADLSRILSSGRLDSEYYQPLYEDLIKMIMSKSHYTIHELVQFNKRGIQPNYIKNGEINTLTSKHLGMKSIDYENLDHTSLDEWESNSEARANYLDILTYTTGAYVGRTNCFLRKEKTMASNHVNILRINERINPIFLAVFLNSFLGEMQMRKQASGSDQVELYPDDIEKIVVWDAPKRIQEKVASLVLESDNLRKNAILSFQKMIELIENKISVK